MKGAKMLTLSVRTDNAAFEGENLDHECARILRRIAARIEQGDYTSKAQTVADANGNDVGRWKLTTEE